MTSLIKQAFLPRPSSTFTLTLTLTLTRQTPHNPSLTSSLNPHPRLITTTPPLSTPQPQRNQHNPRILTILERTILSPERAETTCSGTDNSVGSDTFAYDPSTTTPEVELSAFEAELRVEGEDDPLFISPANRDFSQLLDRELDGRAVLRDQVDRRGGEGSSRGWVNKKRMVKVRGLVDKHGNGKEKVVGMDEYERLLRGLRRVQMEREAAAKKDAGESKRE